MKSLRLSRISIAAVAGAAALFLFVPRASTQPPQPQSTLSPDELQSLNKAHSVINWTDKEIHKQKELKKLQMAANQDDLAKILQQAGEQVEAFVSKFPDLTANESIQWKLDNPNQPMSYSGQFHYVLARSSAADKLILVEHRTDSTGNPINYSTYDGAYLLTIGFARTVLFLASQNQAFCRFRYFGREAIDDHDADVVGFAEIPEKGLDLSDFNDGHRIIPLIFQGLAWIDSRTHQILRMQTDLLAPPPGKMLMRETTQIDFAPVHLPGGVPELVLPQRVVVDMWQNTVKADLSSTSGEKTKASGHREVATGGNNLDQAEVHCHNVHTYSNYRLGEAENLN
jgi:hypothetical protein